MSRFEKLSVWITSIAVALSGFGYTWTKYFVENPDPFTAINHPLEPWFLKVHVVSAPLFVFAIGLLAGRHIWTHIKNRVQFGRRTGFTIVGVIVPMVLTGYLIQVITPLSLLAALAVSHIGLGVLFTVGMVLHQLTVGRRQKGPG